MGVSFFVSEKGKTAMSKFTEYIGSQFGNPHGIIGKICCLIMNTINKTMYKKMMSLITIKSEERILDIGYGNGYLFKQIYKKCKADMYGVDISDDMKCQAMRNNQAAIKEQNLHLQVGDCCDLNYEDNYFSAVTSINTIYFWKDIKKGLSEIKRVLKDGKSFYNILYTKEWLDKLSYTKKGFKKFETEQLVEFGRAVGFKKIEIEEIVKGKSFAVIYTKS